jgi:hypothetical protein
MALPDFLTTGEPVVELFSNAARPVEIVRTTPTQVVIDDGSGPPRRFRFAYGRMVEVGVDFHKSSTLVPASDPRVAGIKREKTIDNARGAVRLAAEARPMYGHGDLGDLIDAIAKLREVADEQYRVLVGLKESGPA